MPWVLAGGGDLGQLSLEVSAETVPHNLTSDKAVGDGWMDG